MRAFGRALRVDDALVLNAPSKRVRAFAVVISELFSGYPALECGRLFVGDVLLSVNGVKVSEVDMATQLIKLAEDTVEVRAWSRWRAGRGHARTYVCHATHQPYMPPPPPSLLLCVKDCHWRLDAEGVNARYQISDSAAARMHSRTQLRTTNVYVKGTNPTPTKPASTPTPTKPRTSNPPPPTPPSVPSSSPAATAGAGSAGAKTDLLLDLSDEAPTSSAGGVPSAYVGAAGGAAAGSGGGGGGGSGGGGSGGGGGGSGSVGARVDDLLGDLVLDDDDFTPFATAPASASTTPASQPTATAAGDASKAAALAAAVASLPSGPCAPSGFVPAGSGPPPMHAMGGAGYQTQPLPPYAGGYMPAPYSQPAPGGYGAPAIPGGAPVGFSMPPQGMAYAPQPPYAGYAAQAPPGYAPHAPPPGYAPQAPPGYAPQAPPGYAPQAPPGYPPQQPYYPPPRPA